MKIEITKKQIIAIVILIGAAFIYRACEESAQKEKMRNMSTNVFVPL